MATTIRSSPFYASRESLDGLPFKEQAAAMGRELFDVEHRQAVVGEYRLHGRQREVGIVLVVGRIELVAAQHAQEMRLRPHDGMTVGGR